MPIVRSDELLSDLAVPRNNKHLRILPVPDNLHQQSSLCPQKLWIPHLKDLSSQLCPPSQSGHLIPLNKQPHPSVHRLLFPYPFRFPEFLQELTRIYNHLNKFLQYLRIQYLCLPEYHSLSALERRHFSLSSLSPTESVVAAGPQAISNETHSNNDVAVKILFFFICTFLLRHLIFSQWTA